MTYKEFVKTVASATGLEKLSKELQTSLANCAKEIGYTIPTCSCKNKWQDLIWKLQIFVKQHPNGFPIYKWNAPYKRLLLKDGTIIVQSNFTDEQAKQWLEENPTKTEYFKLWNNRKSAKKVTEDKTEEPITEDKSEEPDEPIKPNEEENKNEIDEPDGNK